MGVDVIVFLLGLIYSGVVAKGSEDGLSSGPSLARTTDSNKEMVYEPGKQFNRFLLAETKLQSSKTMPEMDVVTPITTVPVLNPTITTPTSTTPDYNPFPTTSTTPTSDPYSTPAMVTPSSSSSSSQSWCVASQTASKTALQVALDYACGYGGADCSAIREGGSCYNPNTVRDHASYAFNEYYQKNPIPTSCDFGGTAVITNVDPSTSTCQHPSTSTSSSVLNTTIPTGSTVFGSVPPSTSGSTLMLNGTTLVITVTCLVMSLFLLECLQRRHQRYSVMIPKRNGSMAIVCSGTYGFPQQGGGKEAHLMSHSRSGEVDREVLSSRAHGQQCVTRKLPVADIDDEQLTSFSEL